MSIRLNARLFLVVGACGFSMHAEAQSTVQEQTAAADSALQEIVVTANKREQKLSDVGLTVSVLTADTLKAEQVSSPADLANVVPGLSYTTSPTGTPVFTLRGIGYYEKSLSAYPTVTVYSDQMPLPFLALAKHSLYDLDQVEVLKGPQGTLFGENSTGGAINYIAAKPTKDFSSGVSLTYGRFNEVQTEDFVSGALSSNLEGRATVRLERADGWQESNSRPGDHNGQVGNYMGRVQLAFHPTESMNFLFNVNGWKDNSQPEAPQMLSFNAQLPAGFVPPLSTQHASPMTDRAADWVPGLPFADNTMWQTSLRGDIDITRKIVLTSLTSYVDYRQNQGDPLSGLPVNNIDYPDDQGFIRTVFQELRLSGSSDAGTTHWVLGGNYEHTHVYQNIVSESDVSTSTVVYGSLGYPIHGNSFYTDQHMQNYAFFGNLEQVVVDTVTLRAGVRYTDSEASARSCNYSPASNPLIGQLFYDVLLGGKFGAYPIGSCWQLNDQAVTIAGVAPGAPGIYVGSQNQNNTSWRIGADWKAIPELLVYGNIAKGYKAGSYPTTSGSGFASYLPVSQESVLSYETGVKSTLFDQKLQANATAYYYDYTDKQLTTKINSPLFGVLDAIQNIPKSHVEGAEFEVIAHPIRHLSAQMAFTYTKAIIDRFSGLNNAGVSANFAGSTIPYTPKFQFGANIDYTIPITQKFDGFAGVGVNSRSATKSVIGNPSSPPTAAIQSNDLFAIDAYSTVDLRAGISSPDARWRLALWGKNVFNKYYWNNTITGYDTIVRYAGMPATYGVTASYRF